MATATETVYFHSSAALLFSSDRPCVVLSTRSWAAVKYRPPQRRALGRLHKLSTRCFVGKVKLVLDSIAQPSPGRLFLCTLSSATSGRLLRQLKIGLLHAVSIPGSSGSLLSAVAHSSPPGRRRRTSLSAERCRAAGHAGKLPPFPSGRESGAPGRDLGWHRQPGPSETDLLFLALLFSREGFY